MSGESDHCGNGTTQTCDPILTAKFRVPATQPWTVARQRLLDRVSLGAGGPLTLVTAPAGSGKTVLAGSWASSGRAPGPVVWLSLDKHDDQPGVVWSYILAGLVRGGVPVSLEGMPSRSDSEDEYVLVRLAAAISEHPRPVVLILDDAQVLTRPETSEGIDFLLTHAGPQLRLIVLSRLDPALPLHRYRVAGSMVEIRLDELAFTVAEARTLIAAHGTDLQDPELIALVRRTKGWAAGLRLGALWLQRQVAAGNPVDCTGIQGDIEEYFVAEVLDVQPSGIRDFLLRTSVVDRIWPGLAAHLSGHRDAPQTLATLAHANAFVAPNPIDRHSYEYHPIVRDLLRSQLRHEAPDKVAQLHRKAAQWLAHAGLVPDAVAHAAAAGDWQQAATLLVENLAIGSLIAGPRSDRLAGALAGMPAEHTDPAVAVVHAALALARLDPDLCAKRLARAAGRSDVTAAGSAALRLSGAVTEIVCAGQRGEASSALTAAASTEAAIAELVDGGATVPPDLRVLVLLNKGRALLRRGDIASAGTAFTTALTTADADGCEHLRPDCLGQLAMAEALNGRLRRAGEHARNACAATNGADAASANRPIAADIALAWACAEQYDLKAARDHADRAADTEEIRHDPVTAGLLALVRARLLRARGDATGAVAEIKQAHTASSGPVPEWLLDKLVTVEATLRAAGGVPDGAAAVLRRSTPASPQAVLASAVIQFASGATSAATEQVSRIVAQPGLALDVRVDAWLLAATCDLVLGRTDLARSALQRGLRLAETEKLRRPIIQAHPLLRRFLRQERELVERHAWLSGPAEIPAEVRSRTAAPGAGTARPSAPVVESLTMKETEVLRYLAALLSTEEIARKMFVSVNTVKTHIRGVLRKLAASRRNEAVRRARDLGLV